MRWKNGEKEAEGDWLGDGDGLIEGEKDGDTLGENEALGDWLGDGEGEIDGEKLGLTEGEILA